MALPPYASPSHILGYYGLRIFCTAVLVFLIAPNLVIIPLSFNSEPYFTYPLAGVSLRWYRELLHSERWITAFENSLFVGASATALATSLGTVAALGLARREFPLKGLIVSVLLSPVIVPIVITAVGIYFFYASIGLVNTYLGLILAHTVLGTPLVVVTVTATLTGFDNSLARAGASLGAGPMVVFRRVILPLILPGVVSGALLAFVTSFDEVVVVLFVGGVDQRTLPRQMWSGIRESINPTILAVATLLVCFAIFLMVTLNMLNRRNHRLRAAAFPAES